MIIRVSGVSEVVRDLAKLGDDLGDLRPAFKAIADKGASLAAGFAPKRTGTLARSIEGITGHNYAGVVVKAHYGSVINYGYPPHNIKADHFLQKADEVLGSTVEHTISAEIDRDISKRRLR